MLNPYSIGVHAGKNVDGPWQGRIQADDAVGMIDVGGLTDFLIIKSEEGRNRSAPSLKPKGGNCAKLLA